MISPYPHNYKSKNYPIYYEFSSFKQAVQKMIWIDQFLRKNGILRAYLSGKRIINEEILWQGGVKAEHGQTIKSTPEPFSTTLNEAPE